VSILNELRTFSVPCQERLPLIQIPCVGHTANLAVGNFFRGSKGPKFCDIQRILAVLPGDTDLPVSDVPRLQEEHWFSLGEIINCITIHWRQVIGFLNENRETESLAAMNHLDIVRLNEIMVTFTRLINCVKRSLVSYFDIFPMLQKLMVNLGSLPTNKKCRNSHAGGTRTVFTNDRFEGHIRLLPSDVS
jgi:hypothetical protein